MKKLSTGLAAIALGVIFLSQTVYAEENQQDVAAITQACTEESRGAIDVAEYIEECVKLKLEDMKEASGEASKPE